MKPGKDFTYTQSRSLQILSNSGPLTARELAETFPVCMRTMQRVTTALRLAGAAHITGYRANPQGKPSAVFAAGAGVDAAIPACTTSAERGAAMRRRWSPEERDFARARRRALARKPRRDRLTVALFGRVPPTFESSNHV